MAWDCLEAEVAAEFGALRATKDEELERQTHAYCTYYQAVTRDPRTKGCWTWGSGKAREKLCACGRKLARYEHTCMTCLRAQRKSKYRNVVKPGDKRLLRGDERKRKP